jgi:hypothetical protein
MYLVARLNGGANSDDIKTSSLCLFSCMEKESVAMCGRTKGRLMAIEGYL